MGIEESSDKALRVMQITTVMVVLLLGWSFYTLFRVGVHLPPLPTPSNLHFSDEALGFLKGTNFAKMMGLFGILIAFGTRREIASRAGRYLSCTGLTIIGPLAGSRSRMTGLLGKIAPLS